jgi:hypothetical protein
VGALPVASFLRVESPSVLLNQPDYVPHLHHDLSIRDGCVVSDRPKAPIFCKLPVEETMALYGSPTWLHCYADPLTNFKIAGLPDIRRGRADHHFERTWLNHPFHIAIENREVVGCEYKLNVF